MGDLLNDKRTDILYNIIKEEEEKRLLEKTEISVNDFISNIDNVNFKNSLKTVFNSITIEDKSLNDIIDYIKLNNTKIVKKIDLNKIKTKDEDLYEYLMDKEIKQEVDLTIYLKSEYNRNDVLDIIISSIETLSNEFELVPEEFYGKTNSNNTSGNQHNIEFVDIKNKLYIKILLKDNYSSKGKGGGKETEVFDEMMTQLSIWILYKDKDNKIDNIIDLKNEIEKLMNNDDEIKKSGIEKGKLNEFKKIYNRYGEDKIIRELNKNGYIERVKSLKTSIYHKNLVKVFIQDGKDFKGLFNRLRKENIIPSSLDMSKWNPSDLVMVFEDEEILKDKKLITNYEDLQKLEYKDGKIYNKFGIYGYSIKKLKGGKVIARGGKITPKKIIGLFDENLLNEYDKKMLNSLLINTKNTKNVNKLMDIVIKKEINSISNKYNVKSILNEIYKQITSKNSELFDEIIKNLNKKEFDFIFSIINPVVSKEIITTIDTLFEILMNKDKYFKELSKYIIVINNTKETSSRKIIEKCYNNIDERDNKYNIEYKNVTLELVDSKNKKLDLYMKLKGILNFYSELINMIYNKKDDEIILLFETNQEKEDLKTLIKLLFFEIDTNIMKKLLNIMLHINVLYLYNKILETDKQKDFYDILKENYLYAKSLTPYSMDYIMLGNNYKPEIISKTHNYVVSEGEIIINVNSTSMNFKMKINNENVTMNYRTFNVFTGYTSEIQFK